MTHAVLETVLGKRPVPERGIVDAHGHLWVTSVPGATRGAPVLADEGAIVAELAEFGGHGGVLVLDCQPPGCGRDLTRLAAIAAASGVDVVASTGFHLPRYYAPADWPWSSPKAEVVEGFVAELVTGVPAGPARIRAGAVKAAHTGARGDECERLLACACEAAARAGAPLVVHTERGHGVERLADLLDRYEVKPEQVVLCHVDKRPDLELHEELAGAGFLLEYDTFLRDKYAPDANVWPLLERMLERGRASSVACGLDLADASLWQFGGAAVGMTGLATVVAPRLASLGATQQDIDRLLRANILSRLATPRANGGGSSRAGGAPTRVEVRP